MLRLLMAAAATFGGPWFTESQLNPGDEFRVAWVDLDQDGFRDLLLSRLEDGIRVVSWHRQQTDASFSGTPDWRLSVPAEVTAISWLDCRDTRRRELLLLTRTGVFAVSTASADLRGNLARVWRGDLRPDFVASGAVPFWRNTEQGPTLDWLCVLTGEEMLALAPNSDGSGGLKVAGRWPFVPAPEKKTANMTFSFGEPRGEFEPQSTAGVRFPGRPASIASFAGDAFFHVHEKHRVPLLVNLDQDPVQKGLLFLPTGLMMVANGEALADSRRIPWPDVLQNQNNGGPKGVLRLLEEPAPFVIWTRDEDGGDAAATLMVLPLEDQERFGKPTARLKWEADSAVFRFPDVDGDGLTDVVVRLIEVPSSVTTLGEVELENRLLIYRGLGQGRFSRKPDLKLERRYPPEKLERIGETLLFSMDGDFDGDGARDLLSMDPDGALEILPLRISAAGDLDWADEVFAKTPLRSLVQRVEVQELSADPVSDLVLYHEHSLTIFASRGGS